MTKYRWLLGILTLVCMWLGCDGGSVYKYYIVEQNMHEFKHAFEDTLNNISYELSGNFNFDNRQLFSGFSLEITNRSRDTLLYLRGTSRLRSKYYTYEIQENYASPIALPPFRTTEFILALRTREIFARSEYSVPSDEEVVLNLGTIGKDGFKIKGPEVHLHPN